MFPFFQTLEPDPIIIFYEGNIESIYGFLVLKILT